MKYFLSTFVLLIILYSGLSQGVATITGTIGDSITKQPVENAEIQIPKLGMATISGANGSFEFKNIKPGYYKIIIKHISYRTKEKNIELRKGQNQVLTILLSTEMRRLNEFTIIQNSERENLISRIPYIKTTVVQSGITKSSAGGIGDFLRGSSNISGIRKGGAGIDPVVRGFKFSQLNVITDNGQKIEGGCPNRMDPAVSHLDIEDIKRIDIYKGPYALRYGPNFGGTLNLITFAPEKYDGFIVNVNALMGFQSNWNGTKGKLSVTGGDKKFFFGISGNHKNYGNYLDGNGNKVNASYTKYNYGGFAGVRIGKNHTVIFKYDESKGRNVDFPALPMDERKDDTRLMSFDYKGTFDNGVLDFITLKVYDSDVNHKMDNKDRPVSDTVVAVSDIAAVNKGLRAETGVNLKNGILYAGVDYEYITKDGERVKSMILQPGLPVKKEKLWNNALIRNTGIFTQYSATFSSWDFTASARADFNYGSSDEIVITAPMQGEIYRYSTDSIESDFTNFSFNAGATKHFNEKIAISLSAGSGTRSPDMVERYIILLPVGYDKFDYLGNPQLKPETNNQVDLTFKLTDEKYGLMQINGFYSLINNYITGKRLPPSVQKPLTKGVLGVKRFYNAGNAKMRGFEFIYSSPVRFRLGVDIFAAYTYGTINNSKRYIVNEQGQVTGDEELVNDALAEIPPFETTVIVKYSLFDGKFVPALAVRTVASQNHISQSQYEQASPGFVTAKFYFRYYFNKHLSVTGGVNNIFDNAYFEHLNRNIIGEKYELYEPGRSFWVNLYFKI